MEDEEAALRVRDGGGAAPRFHARRQSAGLESGTVDAIYLPRQVTAAVPARSLGPDDDHAAAVVDGDGRVLA